MFDQILPQGSEVLRAHTNDLAGIGPVIVNRDLNGRVRLIFPATADADPAVRRILKSVVCTLSERLGAHTFPPEQSVLLEDEMATLLEGAPSFPLAGIPNVLVVDRLATESNWMTIAPISEQVLRLVFFSIKGGLGRSTALAASAWVLAQAGRRVLILDLDLESPGLSAALLPDERRPGYGIADWLVEDLVDRGNAVLEDLIATSTLAHDGEICVVPAHGRDPGEYVAKLGRVWMSKIGDDGTRENWSQRLGRLIDSLERHLGPDIILIDSRAGIDEIASGCVTDLGAALVLLFAIDSEQTWSGYRILFRHWRRSGVVPDIRERLQLVGAMIPDDQGRPAYLEGLRERAYLRRGLVRRDPTR